MKYGYGSKMKSIEYESQPEFQESDVKTNIIKSKQIKDDWIEIEESKWSKRKNLRKNEI